MKFTQLAHRVSDLVASPWAFWLALSTVLGWAILGPVFGWSDTHQLVINTATTIVTFLMVFLLQNAQNRDTRAMQRKLDELIHGVRNADDRIAGIEKREDGETPDVG